MKILTILTGKIIPVEFRGKPIPTGFFKHPVPGPVMLRSLTLEGDEQADLRVHGGADKALYAYPYDSYDAWRRFKPGIDFQPGAFGENLCMSSLDEKEICLGDTFELGDAVIQVTQPRYPCFKLGIKFNDQAMVQDFDRFGRPGVYFRVLREGLIAVGDEMKLVKREAVLVPVQEIFEMTELDPLRIEEILQVESLTEKMRNKYQSFLDSQSAMVPE
ncbi:MAG: MOSC domain-containing protein [Proteobacteria bacterium]|nr:MAG: MOSC domain-containing protein [Pseudomonadota bacterium]